MYRVRNQIVNGRVRTQVNQDQGQVGIHQLQGLDDDEIRDRDRHGGISRLARMKLYAGFLTSEAHAGKGVGSRRGEQPG